MANKLFLQLVAQYLEGGETRKREVAIKGPHEISLAGSGEASGRYTATTSAAAIPVPSGTVGFAFIENLDPDNFVELGWDDTGFVEADKIPAGCWTIKWLHPSRTWQWQADTASCAMRIAIFPA